MSDLTHDIRTKVAEREHLVLFAVAQATGRDIAEIVRGLIVEFADAEVHRARTVNACLRGSEGNAETSEGGAGK